MKRFFMITAVVLAALAAALCSAIMLCVKSHAVHQYVISRVNAAIPGTLSLGKLDISVFSMRIDIRDITLADSSGRKCAGLKRLLVDISPFALIQRKLIVQEAVIENPWAVLEVDSSGQLTLLEAFPKGKPELRDTLKKPDSKSKPFIIELHSLDIIGGTAFFAADQDSFRVQAYGVSLAADGESGTLSGNLTVKVDSAALKKSAETLHVYDFALMARVRDMNIDTMDLRVRTTNSSIVLNGNTSSLANDPVVNIFLDADLDVEEIGLIAGLEKTLTGNSKMRMHCSGRVSNPDLDLDFAYGGGNVLGYPVESILLKAHLTDRVLELKPLHADAAAGMVDITGGVDMRGMFSSGFLKTPRSVQDLKYKLALSADGIYIDKIAPGVSGLAAISVVLDGQGADPDSLIAKCIVSARVDALRIDTSNSSLDATASCSASVANGTAHIHGFNGTLGSTTLSLNGQYGISSGKINAALVLAAPKLAELLKFAGTDSVSGSADIAIKADGDLKNLQATVDLNAGTLALKSLRIGTVALSGELDKNGTAHVKNLTLTNRTSQVMLAGSAHVLHNGTPVPVDSMQFDFSVSSNKLTIEDFIDSAAGKVSLDAKVKGPIDDPGGYIRLSVADLSAAGQRIETISLDALFENKRVIINPLRIAILSGQELIVSGWASMKDSFAIALYSKGIDLTSIAALKAVDSLRGIFSLDLQAGGTYTDPAAEGTLGVGSIRMGALALDDIGLNVDLHNQQLDISGKVIGDIHAGYNIDSRAFFADLVFNNLLLKPYLALSGQNLDGMVTASVKVSGNTDTLTGITAALNVTNLDIDYNNVPIVKTDNLSAVLENNQYAVPDFKIILAGEGSLNGSAKGNIKGPHDIVLNGTVPLAIVRHFSEDFPDIEGTVGIDVFLKGMPGNPELGADIQLENLGLSLPGLSGRLHSLNGRITADPEAVRIESLKGNIDNGVVRMSGALKLDKLVPSDVKADIQLSNLPIGVPDMLDLVLDGNLHLAGNPDTTHLTGDIALLDGLYYQDIVINPLAGMGQRKRKESAPPAENTTPYLKNMRFDIGIQARSPFRVDNNMAQLTIAPDLQLMGSMQSPALDGRANVEQGTITYQKKVFTVDRGVIDFVNPYAIEPQIGISGTIPVREWIIQILISGTPDDLVLKLSSEGSGLEDQDLLSLLVLGKTTAELQNDIETRGEGLSNQQMLASLVASTFGDDIKKAAGLDILQIETGDEQSENSDRIAVTMGKQLTKRLGTKYTVESREGEVVQRATAEYRILQNLNVAGFQDTKGIFGGELRLNWETR